MTARLSSLVDDLADHEIEGPDVEVTLVTQDSHAVVPGALYCCIVGSRTDGHDLAGDVVRAGAGSLLVERRLDVTVPQVRVPSTRRAVGPVAAAFWEHPSTAMSVVGVTGTNGKTTTTLLLAAILEADGRQCGVLGTLSGARTTPEAPVVQSQLASFRDGGCDAVAMEVSSIALDQRRVDGIEFAVGVFSNLSQDHLDYHGDMATYARAKAMLFEPDRCRLGVFNADDPIGRQLLEHATIPALSFGLVDAEGLAVGAAGSTFLWRGHRVAMPLGGRHNVSNALAAATVASALGVEDAAIAAGLTQAPVVPGRWEAVDAGQPFTVVVDYAHTPDGIEQVLRAARASITPEHRVIVVFGCGGDRDRAKRPLMAAAAVALADAAILTSDNPRSEDPMAIIEEAAAGAVGAVNLSIEPDRERAIDLALSLAAPGDLVVIAGKGHETTQTIGSSVLPFDDRDVARRLLAARAG